MKISANRLHIGTSGWSYKDWLGVFYPAGTKAADYLTHYSGQFDTVEIDSTFYAIPRASVVQGWFDKTADNFTFSPKVPQIITHEKRLQNCASEWKAFIDIIGILKHKLGPIVLQFDYQFKFEEYFEYLEKFLQQNSYTHLRLCVEVRHKGWHQPAFFDLLRQHNVALVLNDLYYMPRIIELTADFTFIRLLGNRKQIPDDFSHSRVNRDKDLDWWADWIEKFLEKELEVWVYSNNRYQGHAPDTIRALQSRIKSG